MPPNVWGQTDNMMAEIHDIHPISGVMKTQVEELTTHRYNTMINLSMWLQIYNVVVLDT